MTKQISIVKAAGIVSFFTLLSRLFGLIRDIIIAYIFPKRYTDAFFVAFTIPNVLRRLLAEGTLTIAFIPVFTEYRKKSYEDAFSFASATFTATAVVVGLVSVIGILLSPVIVLMFAGGFSSDSYKFEMTVNLTRIMFPYIFFISLMALSMGVLNTLKHFVTPAAAPVFLNFSLIAAGLSAPKLGNMLGIESIYILAWGVILGGLLQFLIQIPPLASRKFLPRLSFNFKHPGVIKMGKLMLPALFGLAIYQINIMLSRFLASFLDSGTVTYLYYSQRLIEFPMGIFTAAIATASMPSFSKHASDEDYLKLKQTFKSSLMMTLFVIVPSMIGLIALAVPIISMFFQRGQFSYDMTLKTSESLIAFALGLPAMSIVKQAVSAFYALQDTKTPVYVSAVALLTYLGFALILMWPMKHAGLALAITLASWTNASLLLWKLNKRLDGLGLGKMFSDALKMFIAALAMGGVAWYVALYGNWSAGGNNLYSLGVLISAVVSASLVYAAASFFMGIPYLRKFVSLITRKFS